MEVIKKYKHQLYFHLLLNLAFGIWITFASFVHIPLHDFKDHLFYFAHFLMLQFSIFGFLYFLSINRLLFVIVFPIAFLLFSCAAYWVYFQDITISQSIIQAAVETKPDVVFDLISIPFALYLIVTILIVIVILRYYRRVDVNPVKSPLILLALFGMLLYPIIEHYKGGAFNRRLPFNIIASTEDYFKQNKLLLLSITEPLKTANDSLSIVFILGESVRADHMQLNGYSRMTNPLLAQKTNLISFPNVYTPNTYTAKSVPQILTDASLSDDYSAAKYSLIDVLNHAHIETNWIGNQTPEKSYEIFIEQSKFHTIIDPLHSELNFKKDYDAKLLPIFKSVFNTNKNQFTTLHMMGSHWWYETRYPASFRAFKPVIKSKHIPSNTDQEMFNSYDNTIVYLDYFINETIKQVQQKNANTLVIYLSDHGELLGEHNLWLHAQTAEASKNPALLIWYSDKFKLKNPEVIKGFERNKTSKIDMDFFFQTILDLYQVEGIPYKKDKILYRETSRP